MNIDETIKTAEGMANVSWWKALILHQSEAKRLRDESYRFKQAAWSAEKRNSDASEFIQSAADAGQEADTHRKLANGQLARYWSVFDAVKRHRPELLGVFPFADGIDIDDIDPKAAARSMNELVGKLLAVGNDPTRHDTTRHDTKDDIGKKGRKKRKMNAKAADCARRYRDDKGLTPMKAIVEDYIFEQGGSFDGIMKVLSDNPDQWKTADQTRHKDDN
jgi:hypothetical protein